MSDTLVDRKPAPDDEALIRAFTHDRFVDMFLSQNRRAQSGLLVAALIVGYIWFNRTHSLAPLVWVGFAVAVTTIRFLLTATLVSGTTPGRSTLRIGAALFVNGLLMAGPLVAFDQLSELERAAVSIILLATATASAATTSGYRSIFLAFAAPMLLPLALAWAMVQRGDQMSAGPMGLAFLIVLFLAFLVSVGRQANRIFEDSSRYRYGEQQLNRELKRALERADESNRSKTQFLAAASHDLRQPIHSMNVLVAALSLRSIDPGSREIVCLLDSVNQTLSKQLDSLLDISKLDAGAVVPQTATHRLDVLLHSHYKSMLPVSDERDRRMELTIADEVSVETDEALLGRVLSNLVDNAFKFTRRGGTIRLALKRFGANAILTVSDDGIGISREDHERIFQEFYQVANVERDRSKGLGLGLSIVSRLCKLLGVALSLESEQGVGTTFTLTLPATTLGQQVAAEAPSLQMPKGLSVLVIDDEALVRQSMRLLLTQLGCTAPLAEGIQQAVEIAARQHIDVVLSDYRLRDGESGISAIESVLAIHPAASAALITGDTAPDRILEAKSAGVPLLHKPVTLEKLLSVMQPRAIHHRRTGGTEDDQRTEPSREL